MIASNAPFQLITTMNEWGEGTSVESAQEWASTSGYGAYLDALHNNGNAPPPSATATATAGTTVIATVTHTRTPTATPTAGATVIATVTHTRTPTATATPGGQIVFSDGFESGNLGAWTSSGGLTVQTTYKHAGSYAARGQTTNGATYGKKTLPATYAEGYARLYFNLLSASTSSQVNLLRLRTAADSSLVYLGVDTGRHLFLRNDIGAATYTSATTVAPGSGWHALELHARLAGTTSVVEVWLGGTRVADLSRTVSLGSTPIGRLQIGEVNTGRTYDVVFDDVIFNTLPLGGESGMAIK
jgi:hypothetical protein